MASKRSGTVRKHETAVGRDHDDVCSVAMSVGNEGDAIGIGQPFEVLCMWEVGMGHDDGVEIKVSKIGDTFVDCSIESAAGLPQNVCAETSCPFSNCGVVAHDPDLKGCSSAYNCGRHRFGECCPLRWFKGIGETRFCIGERLDGNEYSSCGLRCGHRRSVGRVGCITPRRSFVPILSSQ
ncbi:unannotated protein [freshwater metagenome]|uniref:Unannotated protein n=1 Tax=freshwater metagenome TaxID=449393 RepID=A0A6J6H914_9ZZZZ